VKKHAQATKITIKPRKQEGLLYLAGRCKAGVEIVFIHPVLQIADP